MTETIQLWLSDEKKSVCAGESLARSLYICPLTILLSGPLGAGKTTFIQGLAQGLGIGERITSPTFALERCFRTQSGIPFTHIDCYRLSSEGASEQLHATHEHGGIRCIEWSERLSEDAIDEPKILIALAEKDAGRSAALEFRDIALPSVTWIQRMQRDVRLPENVVRHCDAVGAYAEELASLLLQSGTVCRPKTLYLAGLLHDLFRFIDFHDGAGPPGDVPSSEDLAAWRPWKEHWKGMRHEEACARYLTEQRFPALASIVAVHGLTLPAPDRVAIEQKILFYADKRMQGDTIVTLRQRFDDFRKRYSSGKESERGRIWYEEALKVEQALFPKGAP